MRVKADTIAMASLTCGIVTGLETVAMDVLVLGEVEVHPAETDSAPPTTSQLSWSHHFQPTRAFPAFGFQVDVAILHRTL